MARISSGRVLTVNRTLRYTLVQACATPVCTYNPTQVSRAPELRNRVRFNLHLDVPDGAVKAEVVATDLFALEVEQKALFHADSPSWPTK